MGNWLALHFIDPDYTPNPKKPLQFDQLYGFAEGRKPREMIATVQEMEDAKIPLHKRDYCAHLLINFMNCRREKAPFLFRCGHEKHEYEHCEAEDFILRMKEYEREKRLMQRQKRKEAKEKAESLEE